MSCEDCYAGPQDSAGAERPSARKGAPDGTALVMARGDGGVFYDVLVQVWDDETGRQEAQVRCICFFQPDRLMLEVFNIVGII